MIWYVDLTHKYKVIQCVLVGRSPPLGRSPSKYNFFYHTTFRAVLGRGRDLVCRSKIYPDPKFFGPIKIFTKKVSSKKTLTEIFFYEIKFAKKKFHPFFNPFSKFKVFFKLTKTVEQLLKEFFAKKMVEGGLGS